ncbi:hypothetical protein CHUAL_005013 [Chamberlinius hualienensis]
MENIRIIIIIVFNITIIIFSSFVIQNSATSNEEAVCILGGNASCHVRCSDIGYVTGFCNRYDNCCCTYDPQLPDCFPASS